MENNINSQSQNSIDQKKLQYFMEVVLSDLGGAYSAVLVYIGDKLGLYKAMKDAGRPITSQELADVTRTSERNIREWLANQAAGSYVMYDAETQRYWLPAENALVLADENSLVYAVGTFKQRCPTLRMLQRLWRHLEQAEVFHGANTILIFS